MTEEIGKDFTFEIDKAEVKGMYKGAILWTTIGIVIGFFLGFFTFYS